jgi:hypothetical protein
MSPLSGTSVTGTLSVAGNVNATGSVAAGSVVISGDTAMTAAPRGIYQGFCSGQLTTIWSCATVTFDRAVTITRIQIQLKTAAVNCTTSAVIRVGDNASNNQDTTLTNTVASDTGAISRGFTAGIPVVIRITTPSAGCTTSPADANVIVQYKMQ